MDDIESLIFVYLLKNDVYARKVLPHLKDEYFSTKTNKILYNIVVEFFNKYNTAPTHEALSIEINSLSLFENEYVELVNTIDTIKKNNEDINIDYFVEKTEKFCQDKAVYNAIMESIQILDGKTDKDKGALPQILSDALSVCFDTHVGHDYFEDSESRFEEYHRQVTKMPFHLDILNKITNDGILRKTLNMLLGVTGAGKTHVMCDFAAGYLSLGQNVLYITLEMAEERIAERIDANLMNVPVNDLKLIPKDSYVKKIDRLQSKTRGKLIIKEYPTASVGAGHFRYLLNELRMKKNFVPDVVFIDYINLCTSSRIKMGASVNSYSYIKAIAEELRGLAVEFNIAIWSATQANRDGYNNSDIDLTNTSESIGLPATVDFMLGLVVTEELEEMNRMMMKQLKNRYNCPSYYRRFLVGVDRARMKLFDVEQTGMEASNEAVSHNSVTSKPSAPNVRFDDWK